MYTDLHPEEIKLDAMQRAWQTNRRTSSALSFFEDNPEIEGLFSPQQNPCLSTPNKQCTSPPPPTFTSSDVESDDEFLEAQDQFKVKKLPSKKAPQLLLDASEVGDLPACYAIHPVESHQFPVAGVYVDRRIVPGFKYRVRPLPGLNEHNFKQKCLFGGKALTLESIGRGYAKRFTFEADNNSLNENGNYFWADNRPEGYAFELEVISEGDKFTIFSLDGEAQGTVEIVNIEGNQIELGSLITKEGFEKKVKVKVTAKIEFYETGVSKLMPFSGIVICVRHKNQTKAVITKVTNVTIKRHRYYLTPGYQNNCRRVTVSGINIGDVPTKYTMTGLEPYEIPVVGTYVDPRVIPGFYYRVRPNHRKQHLFEGQTLKLNSIGMGYAKRLTFASTSQLNPDNYFWSDNHPDGLGLEPRAVHNNMKFSITANNQVLGEAKVFRADMPQMEEKMEKELTASGKYAIIKYIHIEVMCHVKLEINGNHSSPENEHLMRVYGLAVVRKEPNSNISHIVRVDNVGLDSQLNILFAHNHTELTFLPLD